MKFQVPSSRFHVFRRAFTLLEVMFAVVAFCTATFAMLALISNALRNARELQRPMVDGSAVLGELAQTNQLVEGEDSGNLGDLLGDDYRNYRWTDDVQERETNRLFQVDVIVQRTGASGRPVVSKMSTLFFRPRSPAGSLDGGMNGGAVP